MILEAKKSIWRTGMYIEEWMKIDVKLINLQVNIQKTNGLVNEWMETGMKLMNLRVKI